MNEFQYTLDDFLRQIKEAARLKTYLEWLFRSVPESERLFVLGSDRGLKRVAGIIDAMTDEEKTSPKQMGESHRNRIAAGSGTSPQEVLNVVEAYVFIQESLPQMSFMMEKNYLVRACRNKDFSLN